MAIVRTLIGNVKGVKGDTGATGAQGNAGEITIGSVTTGSYGTPASVTNSGTATDAVLDFVIPQGAPGETVTDASPLTASTITTSTAQYPTYTAGETLAVILGKISKFFSDIRTNGLFKGNLVDGFTQDTAGINALDAKAGKTLNDAIGSLNTSLSNYALKTDFSNYISLLGIAENGAVHYFGNNSNANDIDKIFVLGGGSNYPTTNQLWYVMTLPYISISGNRKQFASLYNNNSSTIYTRSYNTSSGWTAWAQN